MFLGNARRMHRDVFHPRLGACSGPVRLGQWRGLPSEGGSPDSAVFKRAQAKVLP
jgi:hypothetical protein